MGKKAQKGDADEPHPGVAPGGDEEYKTRENMKLKEYLKKKLSEEKGVDEKFKTVVIFLFYKRKLILLLMIQLIKHSKGSL